MPDGSMGGRRWVVKWRFMPRSIRAEVARDAQRRGISKSQARAEWLRRHR